MSLVEFIQMSTDPKDPNYRLVVRRNDGAWDGLYEVGEEELTSHSAHPEVTEKRCCIYTHEQLVWLHEMIGRVLAAAYREGQQECVDKINELNRLRQNLTMGDGV